MGRLSVGRQWRIAAHCGLGIAGEAVLGRLPVRLRGTYSDPPPRYTVKGVAGLVSATFD